MFDQTTGAWGGWGTGKQETKAPRKVLAQMISRNRSLCLNKRLRHLFFSVLNPFNNLLF